MAKIIAGEDLIESIKTMELFTFSEIEILEVGRETEGLEESFKNVIAFNQTHHTFLKTPNTLMYLYVLHTYQTNPQQ